MDKEKISCLFKNKTKTLTKYQIVIGFLLAFVVVVGLAYYLHQYFELLTGASQQIAKNPLQQQAVDLEKLAIDYQQNFDKILSDYLTQAKVSDSIFTEMTNQTQKQLLDLKVPAENREKHLTAVLSLGEIEEFMHQGQSDKATIKLEELRKMINL